MLYWFGIIIAIGNPLSIVEGHVQWAHWLSMPPSLFSAAAATSNFPEEICKNTITITNDKRR